MSFIRSLFGLGPKVNYKEVVNNGAIIVDVRTKGEFKSGHIEGSLNIPLPELNKKLNKLDKSKTIITCCASGVRSGSAKSILKSSGFEAYNGGAWRILKGKI
ncbi:MAG: sulfurtransferase [Fluviicola sp.]|nr:MAG: sulfurtransferase [Fluviicola sp.]